MCGRYSLTSTDGIIDAMQLTIAAVPPELAAARFNIAPTQPAPVVVLRDGGRALAAMRWGMLAPWRGHGGKRGPMLINARLEAVGDKPIFRDAFKKQRCLIVADGFYEWQPADAATGRAKQPFWFHRDPPGVFAFAGIWTVNRDDDQPSFVILTGPPNALTAPVHDRMPIVLAPDAYAPWLDPGVGSELARTLCQPTPIAGWRADAVSSRVNSAAHEDAGCIAAADGSPPAQLRLL